MKISTIAVILAAILIIVGGAWWYTQTTPAPSSTNNTNTGLSTTTNTTSTTTNATSTSTSSPTSSGVDVSVGVGAAKTVTVNYNSSGGFSPSTVTINKGDTVTFVALSGSMWVGADEHPSHTEYDGTSRQQHCASGSNTPFDQCKASSTYSFTFNKVGTFGYHNHMSSSHVGTVIVK